jgi:UrcA family protein
MRSLVLGFKSTVTNFTEMNMNRLNTFGGLRAVLATTLVGAIAASFAVLPAAADSFDAPQITVKYGDLNLGNSQGVATLYSRIQAAAKNVCWQFEGSGIQNTVERNRCVDKAISGAVTKVNNSALSAMYGEKTGKEMPTRVASLQH